jgi:ketosteroid isomerase-like protein
MERERVRDWVAAYQRAWRSPGTDALAGLFTPDATYLQGPYHEPVVGLPAIARMWEVEREGPDEAFTMASEVVAVEGDVAVVRAEVRYGEPVEREFRDLWVIRFARDGRCRAYEEWPFSPGGPVIPATDRAPDVA